MLDWEGAEVTHPEKWSDFSVCFRVILVVTVLNTEVFQFLTSYKLVLKECYRGLPQNKKKNKPVERYSHSWYMTTFYSAVICWHF